MGDSQMVPMEYCHKTFSNGQCQQCDKYSLIISILYSTHRSMKALIISMSDEPPWESTKVCSSAPPKADDGRILCPCFWEVNPLWNIGAGEPGDGHYHSKTNLWRKERFYCKRNFGRWSGGTNAILILCLIWCWILFQEEFTIGQLLEEVKKDFIFTLKLW